MATDSQLHDSADADALRLEQLQLEARAARLEAEAKALEAKLSARKRENGKPKPAAAESKSVAAAPKEIQAAAQRPVPPPRKPSERKLASAQLPSPPAIPAAGAAARKPSAEKPEAEADAPAEPQPSRKAPKSETSPQQATGSPPIDAAKPVPPPDPPADAGHEDESYEEPRRGLFSRMISATPSYMISAVFHLVTLLILAMIMLPLPEEVRQLVVEASALDEQEEIEEVVIETLEEQLDMELEEPMLAQPIDVADPGAADLGAIAQEVPSEVSTFGVSMNDTNIDSIGTLFGDEGEGMADAMDGAGGAEFFGVRASGRKFVFIVDSSLSMKNGKFEAACEELMYSVSRLSKDQYFYVLFFDHDAARMTFLGNDKPEERCVPATTENIKKLGLWVRTVQLELRTDPYDCAEFAMKLLPDAIYILTDGKFTDRGKAVRYLEDVNLYEDPIDGIKPKVVIHTVGFYQRDGEPTLKPLAKLHGGTYRFVPKPPRR